MPLLDTCALLWLVGQRDRLSDAARAAIDSSEGDLAVCAISAFEIGLKFAHRELELPRPASEWYARALWIHGVREIPVDGRCALSAAALPPIHRDPCDRMVIATAQLHGMPILTPDPIIAKYPGVRVIW
jgi:PIN domain nuclease of toxin-antitoxin system